MVARVGSVGIHLKVLSSQLDTALLVQRASEVFGQVGISITVVGRENLSHLPRALAIPRVGNCVPPPTNDQLTLFRQGQRVPGSEIVFYFVRQTRPDFLGCAVHPVTEPGAIIANTASQWTLAHELGHILGLSHVSGQGRLMVGSTRRLGAPPPWPMLTQEETAIMSASPLVH